MLRFRILFLISIILYGNFNENCVNAQGSLLNTFYDSLGINRRPNPNAQRPSQQIPNNPCPQLFQYVEDGNLIEGEVKLKTSGNDPVINLKFEANIPGSISANNIGSIELINSEATVKQDILTGRPVLYRVVFPRTSAIPYVTGIYYNDQKICTGPRSSGTSTNYNLLFKLETGIRGSGTSLQNSNAQRYEPAPQPQPIPSPRPTYSSNPVQTSNKAPSSSFSQIPDSSVCGVPISSVGLVKGGAQYRRGDWPWLGSFMHKGKFICGGSLISNRVVLTAAHCIQNKQTSSPILASESHFIFGAHNLQNLDHNAQEVRISQFVVNPSWNPDETKYNGDIALAKLASNVQYTNFVRPVCLPPSRTNSQDIVGKKASIDGWGQTDFESVSTEVPSIISIPIVSEVTCLRSGEVFFHIMGDDGICAGGRNSAGPCTGDSGGGLMVNENGKWVARGIVSAAVRGADGSCDLENFVIFTDVAKHMNWIQQNM